MGKTATHIEILQNKIDECRSRGLSLDLIRDLFKAVNCEQPRQWRSIPIILNTLTIDKVDELSESVAKELEKQRTYNDKFFVLYDEYDIKDLDVINNFFLGLKNNSNLLPEYDYTLDSSYSLNEKESSYIHRFTKKRETFSKEEIDLDKLNKTTQSELDEFDKVLGVKATEILCFDSMVIDFENKLLVLQLDLASLIKSSDFDKNIEVFLKMLNELITKGIGKLYCLDKKSNGVNFYPCISKFYTNIEGFVTRLSFTTSKGVHHETLKGAATDIRKADYHIGGKAKENGIIYPYRITKKFEINKNSKPQVFIGVHYQYYAKPGSKFLGNARIFDVLDHNAYEYVIKKLLENR
ncbi:hypothetical protein [Acinetobacter bereziniae]|uniref:hypothetical protein n=1 Tax=Acinetobacter bereziniae TaxID=106648 RepID=UPI000C2C32B3|nr:hypothetical protein [Acinetobacter bereziniae]ATZ65458.1 hypothetical protein BSR55_20080 [Acinetobacter bereziniae]